MAEWSTSYINDLPDSAFLYIEPGGTKDADGKTAPRSLRHFPVRDANGKLDPAHVQNALSRIPQSNVSDSAKAEATAKAHKLAGGDNGGSASGRGQIGDVIVTTDMLLVRAFSAEMQRSGDKLDLALIPFDTPTNVADMLPNGTLDSYVEVFDRSMFAPQVRAAHPETLRKIRFLDGHPSPDNGVSKLGWTMALRAEPTWLHGTVQLLPSRIADVEAMLDAGISDVSVGFQPLPGGTTVRSDGSRLRHKGRLDHIALEPQGAYPGAEVLAMRAALDAEADEKLIEETERLERSELDKWLAEQEERQARYESVLHRS